MDFILSKTLGLAFNFYHHLYNILIKDEEGYWTGIYNEVLGFVLDDRFFDERNIEKPETWDDLLKPEFENQIMVANPGSSGTAFLFLSGMVQARGEEAGLDYMLKFDKSVKQ